MFKHLLAAAMATALVAAPLAPAFAQAATEKADTKSTKTAKAKKELTPQQQKMKDCAVKWADYKKEKNVKGRAEYRKFMSTCLKG
jgi:Ni/Co efflux regulator RcnB